MLLLDMKDILVYLPWWVEKKKNIFLNDIKLKNYEQYL